MTVDKSLTVLKSGRAVKCGPALDNSFVGSPFTAGEPNNIRGILVARINIEDSIFRDDRWLDLLLKTGCKYKSLGIVTSGWILSQRFWLEFGYIPKKHWPKDLEILIVVGFAEAVENGIYIKGSKKAFSWLDQKASAGRNTSEKKLDALKRARSARWNRNDLTLNGSERTLNGSEAPTPTPTPTLTQEDVVVVKKTYFEDFCRKKLSSLDTGFEMIARKVYKAWPTEDAFFEFIATLYDTKSFKKISDPQHQDRYIKASINSELRNRDVK